MTDIAKASPRSTMPMRRGAGFTLLELMVVIAVMGLLLALVLARGPMHSPGVTLRAAAAEVAETLRADRVAAVAGGHPVAFDPARATAAAMRDLPAGVTLTVTAQPPGPILFQPDGSASSGEALLTLGQLSAVVTVDWLTGRVSVGPVLADARR